MGSFLSNIQVFTGLKDSAMLLEELVLAVRDSISGIEYEETEDAELADRSLILQVSSERWISIYDQRLDVQDIDEMDALGAFISARVGVPAVGSVVHDSDLLLMRLYRNGRNADTMISNLDIFNELSEGRRPRKRNGQPSKWLEVCAPGVNPSQLKAIWEQEMVFAEDALMLAADLLAIPAEAALRGYEFEPTLSKNSLKDDLVKVLHFRSKIRFSDYFVQNEAPKMAFTSWHYYAGGNVGMPSTLHFGLTNQGQAFTGLDVLLWGPALEEQLIEMGLGMVNRVSNDFNTREEWTCDLQPSDFEMEQAGTDKRIQVKGYKYEFPEVAFPKGYMQILYPETAAQLGIVDKWIKKFSLPHYSFLLTFTGNSLGNSNLYISIIPREAPKGQVGLSLPVYIGVVPKLDIF
ncbi:hypothetical protein [Paenibacillus sp. sgz500958]|uniref:hypothetical protein n=1 Tax=Paenibacillus sp. sgz500958 TaxID=3242475 RepID=UPI0036D23868